LDEEVGLNKKLRERETGLYYDESDTSSVEVLTGVSKVEAAQAVWWVDALVLLLTHSLRDRGPKSRWFLFVGWV